MNKDVKKYLRRLKPGYTFDTAGDHIAILDPKGNRVATVGKNTYGPTLRKNITMLEKMGALEPTEEKVKTRMPQPSETPFTEQEIELLTTTVGVAGSMQGFARHAIQIAQESDGALRVPSTAQSFAISISNVLNGKGGVSEWVKELMLATARDISEPPPALEEPVPETAAIKGGPKTDDDRIGELLGALALEEEKTEELTKANEKLRAEIITAQQENRSYKAVIERTRAELQGALAKTKDLELRLSKPSAVNRDALRKFVVSARRGDIDQETLVELAFSLLED